jgi:hypothetical protein
MRPGLPRRIRLPARWLAAADHRQPKTTLAMTIMAVTAIICAKTSEVARLLASFMPFSLDSGLGEPGFWT